MHSINDIRQSATYLLSGRWRSHRLFAVGVLLFGAGAGTYTNAITINMHYFNDGDPVPHDENPSWDPDGTILKNHFQAAKAIWEYLLPGGGSYDIDFEWDDDISGLGLTTPGPNLQTLDTLVEINPGRSWFADSTPATNEEFSPTPVQSFYSQLSAADKSTYFPATAPPAALETRFTYNGMAGSAGMGGFDAANGIDLLTVIVHELGHVLGVNDLVGEYDILPEHVGGIEGVEVGRTVNDGGSHLAGNATTPGFLMCNACELTGVRRLPSATDVLVVAEDQGITVVELARVGRISSGTWNDTNAWVGGDVPDITQDVSITHGGFVNIDINASARNLTIAPGNSLATLFDSGITIAKTLNFDGASIQFISTGTLAADVIIGNPADLITAPTSLVRFNQFTRGSSAATAASLGGSVAIGYNTGAGSDVSTTTFDPDFLADWNIGKNLIVGDQNNAVLVVDKGSWMIGGNLSVGVNGGGTGELNLQNSATMAVVGDFNIQRGRVTVENMATLSISGNIAIGQASQLTYKNDRAAASKTHVIAGGSAGVNCPPAGACEIVRTAGGSLIFQDTANAADSAIMLEGGSGDDAPPGLVVFEGNSSASTADFHTKGGHFGPTLPVGPPSYNMVGNGGQVRFEGTSHAGTNSTFVNDGVQDAAPAFWQFGGTGGRTIFTQNSDADHASIHNHGASTALGGNLALGGATHFYDFATAGAANITNHADSAYIHAGMEATTVFYDSSDAGNATIENMGASSGSTLPGRTEFRDDSNAALSNIHNRGFLTPGGLAGRTDFYGHASAEDATIHTYEGYSDAGRIEFHGASTAGNARLIVENVPGIVGSTGNGGHIIFRDNSKADHSQIFIKENACCNGLQFFDHATADHAQILTENESGGVTFWGNSSAENAIIELGRGSVNTYNDSSRAANATYTLGYGSQLSFQNNSSAESAQIIAAGSSLGSYPGATITFNSTSLVNNSTITLNGGTVASATGALAAFINGAHAGDATITANGGANGGTGAQITFNTGAKGDTARIIANAGAIVDFLSQRDYGDGSTTVGSIEGAGSYVLRGSHLISGNRNTNTTVTGTIVDGSFNSGRLTKIGTGTLTLAGTNTYTGLTTINAGTLNVVGSIAGSVVVNNEGTLGGAGAIGGNVTVNAGGTARPGSSPGVMTVGSLSMNTSASLLMEIGGTTAGIGYDRIQSTGAMAFNGSLQVSLFGGFTPSAGQSFDLFNWGSTSGIFSTIILPTLAGLTWNTSQLYTTGVISLNTVNLPGDYNSDGVVNAADYVVWRKGLGTVYTQADYDTWRAHFGQATGSASNAGTSDISVPEPLMATSLFTLAIFAMCLHNSPCFRKVGLR